MESLELTPEWDKTFPRSNKVKHKKVTFTNRYGITLAADMYSPENAVGSGLRSFRRGQGAVFRSLRTGNGGTRIHHTGIRPLVYWRKRRTTALYDLSGHKHGRFQRRR